LFVDGLVGDHRLVAAGQLATPHFPRHSADLTFQLANAALARVLAD